MSAVQATGPRFAWAGGMGLLVFAALGLAGFAVQRELRMHSTGVALVGTAAAVALLATLAFAVYRNRAALGPSGRLFIVAAAVLGMACGGVLAERESTTAREATVHYSDGTQVGGGMPKPVKAWGREMPAFGLHPAFPNARVPNGLEAHFDHAPGKVKASFTKPESSLLTADGKPTRSDGVRIRATLVAPDGSTSPEEVIDLTQEAFFEQRWIHHVFESDDGIASLRLAVEAGPPGANTFNDAMLVGFKATPWVVHASRAGAAVLVGVAFAVFAWWLVAWVAIGSRGEGAVLRDLRGAWAALALAAATIVGVGAWSLAGSEVVYFWDSRNFWEKSETLHDLLAAGAWEAFVAKVAEASTTDYSMFPAILPAAIATLFPQGPTRVVFGLLLIVLYAVPAYLATAWVGSRFAATRGRAAPAPVAWCLAAVAVFVAIPMPFTRTLMLMPDIGGIVLVVLAWSAAAALLRACVEGDGSTALLRAGALLGVTFAAMFLFRRWYVFAAVGLSCMVAVLLLAELVRAPAGRAGIVRRSALGAAVVAAAAFPLLCWVAFTWSKAADGHDYATLYASYHASWQADAMRFYRGFGAVPLLLAVAGLALAWPAGRGDLRRRWWLLVGGTVVAFALFLRVQSPGPHHYNLVVPCLGAGVAVVALRLAARFGLRALLAFILCLAAGNIVATRSPAGSAWRALFPGYDLWLPRQLPALASYREVATWLEAPERKDRKLCVVASSSSLNQGIVPELWQVMPGMARDAIGKRMVKLPEVDSRDGAPRGFEQCELVLVGEPFQTHLAPGQQDNIAVVREALVSARGAGAAFRATGDSFRMAWGARLVAYERIRPVTPEEATALRQRWIDGETAQGHAPPK